jgi:hypothetical protein
MSMSQFHDSRLSRHRFLLRHGIIMTYPLAEICTHRLRWAPRRGLNLHDIQHHLQEVCILQLLRLLQRALTLRASLHDVMEGISHRHRRNYPPLILNSTPVCILEAYVTLHERWLWTDLAIHRDLQLSSLSQIGGSLLKPKMREMRDLLKRNRNSNPQYQLPLRRHRLRVFIYILNPRQTVLYLRPWWLLRLPLSAHLLIHRHPV